jgi:hypothetical protein
VNSSKLVSIVFQFLGVGGADDVPFEINVGVLIQNVQIRDCARCLFDQLFLGYAFLWHGVLMGQGKYIVMPWYNGDYPPSYKNQPVELRNKATEIANELLLHGAPEGVAIATGLKRAREVMGKDRRRVDENGLSRRGPAKKKARISGAAEVKPEKGRNSE